MKLPQTEKTPKRDEWRKIIITWTINPRKTRVVFLLQNHQRTLAFLAGLNEEAHQHPCSCPLAVAAVNTTTGRAVSYLRHFKPRKKTNLLKPCNCLPSLLSHPFFGKQSLTLPAGPRCRPALPAHTHSHHLLSSPSRYRRRAHGRGPYGRPYQWSASKGGATGSSY